MSKQSNFLCVLQRISISIKAPFYRLITVNRKFVDLYTEVTPVLTPCELVFFYGVACYV